MSPKRARHLRYLALGIYASVAAAVALWALQIVVLGVGFFALFVLGVFIALIIYEALISAGLRPRPYDLLAIAAYPLAFP
ncbi:hypothetical protein [Pyrobaculum aerophilum]|uniref:Phosphatidate cytidylyltransferase n=1 Tax=Pyrobaculum aerophilum TaxID=13773 RepID=A0A371QZU8_9CREN|nr:hypothetical protein [Pyrobaculum aerophilum]RFA96154.1 hypothetical protein CGL51_05645 [Pyrobaculum aerophilum]RFA96302.1 hypothetical protein CGL52_11010 [Pyrobaculum aerophilum]